MSVIEPGLARTCTCTSLSRARFGFRSTLQLPQRLAPIHAVSLQLTQASSSDTVVAVRKFEPIKDVPVG